MSVIMSTILMSSTLFFLFICIHMTTSEAKTLRSKQTTTNNNNNRDKNKDRSEQRIHPRGPRPAPNGPIHVERDTLDHLYGSGCMWASRTTGSMSSCTCKKEYATIMAQSGDNWNCHTNKEMDCEHSLGGMNDKNIYIIEETTKNSLELIPPLPGHLTIKNIFLWNFAKDGRAHSHWEKITDVGKYFISLDLDKKKDANDDTTSLSIQGMDLSAWNGHVIKIHFGEYKKCVHAKIKGKMHYPFNVTAFRNSLHLPTPKPTTQNPTTGKPTPTGRTTTTPTHHHGSTTARVVLVVCIILIIVIVVTVAVVVYRRCLKGGCPTDDEQEKSGDVVKTTNHYDIDPVKSTDVVFVKNGKGFDNVAHYETIDEVGRDAADSPRSDVKSSHELDDVKVGDKSDDTQGVMDLYNQIDETSSEEFEMGKDNHGIVDEK